MHNFTDTLCYEVVVGNKIYHHNESVNVRNLNHKLREFFFFFKEKKIIMSDSVLIRIL